ncbi:DUF917 family protein [Rhodococcus sp. 27YEA15]|uniref:DUF917 domain-containing protein n=1 Tax=Rhodococcus sp. 27YEA15 TaxID=3156259 RepID=UPI003C7B0D8E
MTYPPMRHLTLDDVDRLSAGVSFLASGGGGDPLLPVQMLRHSLLQRGPVTLIDAADLDDDAVVLPVVMGGTPSAVVEAFPGRSEILLLREVIERHLGRPCAAILPMQMGPVNGLFPIVVAAELDLPCIDADLMQRCFPALEMTFLTLAGFPLSPIYMVGSSGSYSIMRAGSEQSGSNLLRATLTEMGMVAVVSAYEITARDVRAHGSAGALSRGIELGRLVLDMESGDDHAVERCLAACDGRIVFEGTVVEVVHEVTAGTANAVVTVFGENRADTSVDILRLDQQSENLIATLNGTPVTTVPDIISVLDAETGSVVQNTSLSRGQHIRVVAAPGDRRWHTDEAAALIGPRVFGFDIDPVSVGYRE